jgi:tetratricopeptide (TPR) repeat protein
MLKGMGWGLISIVILAAVLFKLQATIESRYLYPFPPLTTMKFVEDNPYLELGGLFFGMRSVAADIAWIKTLQYYGGATEGETKEEHEHHMEEEAHGGQHNHEQQIHDGDNSAYRKLYSLCARAVWLDPYFIHVYNVGSAAIGFVQERYDEAAVLLKEGVVWNYDPDSVKYWRMNYALAALGYNKVKDYKKAIAILEKMIDPEDSPLILLRVLANTYEKNGDYRKAIKMWRFIGYKFPDQANRANNKMSDLTKRMSD